jgi:hypothetical protein
LAEQKGGAKFEEGTLSVPAAKLTGQQKFSIATNYMGTPEAMYREDGEAVSSPNASRSYSVCQPSADSKRRREDFRKHWICFLLNFN